MNNLKKFFDGADIRHPKDVYRLANTIDDLSRFNDSQIQEIYSHWSELYYCAGWIPVNDQTIEEFADWLFMESE